MQHDGDSLPVRQRGDRLLYHGRSFTLLDGGGLRGCIGVGTIRHVARYGLSAFERITVANVPDGGLLVTISIPTSPSSSNGSPTA